MTATHESVGPISPRSQMTAISAALLSSQTGGSQTGSESSGTRRARATKGHQADKRSEDPRLYVFVLTKDNVVLVSVKIQDFVFVRTKDFVVINFVKTQDLVILLTKDFVLSVGIALTWNIVSLRTQDYPG